METINIEAQQNNSNQILRIRGIISIAAGVAAGAMRLESFDGIAFFALMSLFTSALMFLSMGWPRAFFTNPYKTLLIEGVLGSVFNYMLGWIGVYSLVET